ncbi:MAG TPA: response regulator [Stellaceae bacterium]|nr:response regulator [Stellaceae bacterium]HMD67205.1 response regulator [Stellaceae bacterium]
MPARVLVVEDVPLNVELLTAKLIEYKNCVVSKAYDGFQALAKIKSEKPDIVLLNVDDAEARRI